MLVQQIGQTQARKLQDYQRGNAIVEYALIGVLVVLISIAGLQVTGGNLNAVFALFQKGLTAQAANTDTTVAAQSNAKQSYTAGSGTVLKIEAQPAAVPAPILPVVDTSTPVASTSSLACTATGQCIQTSMTDYSPTQTTGVNGVSLVDYYANVINQIAALVQTDSTVNSDLTALINDLAEEGHNVADDERATLTFTIPSDGTFNFSIQSRYQETLARVTDYLQAHPNELSPEMTQLLTQASNNITQQQIDFLNGADPSGVSSATINQKFTDAGGTQGSTYVDQQAIIVCGTGGQACATQ